MESLDQDQNKVLSSVHGCSSLQRFERRRMLQCASGFVGFSAVGGWTQLAERLAQATTKETGQPKSLIFLWLQGGPSQLETFDPHPGTQIGGETKAIDTSVKGTQISYFLPRTAELMHLATLVRSMVSKEGDHERATYTMKTGWRPDPTLVHPSIGSVLCHQSENNIEIPRHISILSTVWPARGGYMGPEYDAFQVGDPRNPISNLRSPVPKDRQEKRLRDLQNVVESEFQRGRLKDMNNERTQQITATNRAIKMMDSQQIAAFEIDQEPVSVRAKFGESSFGRGCLAAIRLIEQGVRCVEVELSGWDTHINNHGLHETQCTTLDAALYGLITELQSRELLDSTVVVCGGEFGRTPAINPANGRDHWPTGFSTILFGGPFRRGFVHGETTSELLDGDPINGVSDPVPIEDLHATVISAFGIDFTKELQTPIGRPLALSQGKARRSLLS